MQPHTPQFVPDQDPLIATRASHVAALAAEGSALGARQRPRVLARIAGHTALGHVGRAALLACLLALPVAGKAFAGIPDTGTRSAAAAGTAGSSTTPPYLCPGCWLPKVGLESANLTDAYFGPGRAARLT